MIKVEEDIRDLYATTPKRTFPCTWFFLEYTDGSRSEYCYRICEGRIQVFGSSNIKYVNSIVNDGDYKFNTYLKSINKDAKALVDTEVTEMNDIPFNHTYTSEQMIQDMEKYKSELLHVKKLVKEYLSTLTAKRNDEIYRRDWGNAFNNAAARAPVSGGKPKPAFKKTEEKRKLLGRERCVYTQGRKKFIKVKGEFVAIASLKLVAKHKK